MHIPYGYKPTEEELKKEQLRKSFLKAKHLSERLRIFLSDLKKSNFKESEKIQIREAALSFMEDGKDIGVKPEWLTEDVISEVKNLWHQPNLNNSNPYRIQAVKLIKAKAAVVYYNPSIKQAVEIINKYCLK